MNSEWEPVEIFMECGGLDFLLKVIKTYNIQNNEENEEIDVERL